jgi:hypothetical protein
VLGVCDERGRTIGKDHYGTAQPATPADVHH